MRNSNYRGKRGPTSEEVPSEMMRTYDELPTVVRKALQDAAFTFGTANMKAGVETLGAEEVAKRIEQHSRDLWRISWREEIGGDYDHGAPSEPGSSAKVRA